MNFEINTATTNNNNNNNNKNLKLYRFLLSKPPSFLKQQIFKTIDTWHLQESEEKFINVYDKFLSTLGRTDLVFNNTSIHYKDVSRQNFMKLLDSLNHKELCQFMIKEQIGCDEFSQNVTIPEFSLSLQNSTVYSSLMKARVSRFFPHRHNQHHHNYISNTNTNTILNTILKQEPKSRFTEHKTLKNSITNGKFFPNSNIKSIPDIKAQLYNNINYSSIKPAIIERNYNNNEKEQEKNKDVVDIEIDYSNDTDENVDDENTNDENTNDVDDENVDDENTNDENTNDENTNDVDDENVDDENVDDENTDDENTDDENTDDENTDENVDDVDDENVDDENTDENVDDENTDENGDDENVDDENTDENVDDVDDENTDENGDDIDDENTDENVDDENTDENVDDIDDENTDENGDDVDDENTDKKEEKDEETIKYILPQVVDVSNLPDPSNDNREKIITFESVFEKNNNSNFDIDNSLQTLSSSSSSSSYCNVM